jgi:hypothetical protein
MKNGRLISRGSRKYEAVEGRRSGVYRNRGVFVWGLELGQVVLSGLNLLEGYDLSGLGQDSRRISAFSQRPCAPLSRPGNIPQRSEANPVCLSNG